MRVLSFILIAGVSLFLNCSNTAEKTQTVKQIDEKPSRSEMIGQMIMVGVDGTRLNQNPSVSKYLKAGHLGGVIFYEKNIDKVNPKEALMGFCDEIQSASKDLTLIGIDQEGGKVNRLKSKYGFPESVTAMYLGKENNIETTQKYANEMGRTIQELGINVNFAPCVDLCSNPSNPIIAKPERCFSDNPEVVARHAQVFSNTLLEYKILPVLKHFPGHGSSKGDTHLGMADVTEVWQENELIPYKMLIQENSAPAIMSAHIINAKLDPDTLPSTLSKMVLSGILREEMGFKGVVFSDDMQMRAISDHYGLEKAIELAVNAGIDILMFSGNIAGTDTPTIERVHRTFNKLIEEGKITEERLFASYQRVKLLKEKLRN